MRREIFISLVFSLILQFELSSACFEKVPAGSIRVIWGYKGNVFGPVLGGTMILLQAKDGGLDALLKTGATVVLAAPGKNDYLCAKSTETPKSDTIQAFHTPNTDASDIDMEYSIKLKCPSTDDYFDLGKNFTYKPDPKLFEPNLKTIISGGIELKFPGENLMSVGFPVMMLFIEYNDWRGNLVQKGCYKHDNSVEWCKQICLLQNDTELFCRSPDLHKVLPEEHGGSYKRGSEGNSGATWIANFRAAPGLEISKQEEISLYISYLISANMQNKSPDLDRRKREAHVTLVGPEVLDITAKVGMALDGRRRGVTNSTLEKAFDLMVVDDPEFVNFDVKSFNPEFHKNEDTMRITGKYVTSGAHERDMKVTVGGEPCPLAGAPAYNAIICKPPSSPKNLNGPTKSGGYQVVVTIGYNSWSVGFLKYVRWYQSSVFIGIITAVILIPLTLVAVYFLITRCIIHRIDPKNHPWVPGSVISNLNGPDALTRIGSELSGKVQQSGVLLPETTTVKIVDRLGSGNFGVVYAGFLQNENNENENNEYPDYVAIKTLKDTLDDEQVKEMFKEALVMKEFDHPNIVKIIGIVIMRNQPHIIMPFMKNKDLKTHVRNKKNRFSVHDLLEYGIQVATGMAHVESKGVVHRDLAIRNCMVSDQETIKVADFGLAKETTYQIYTQQSRGGGLPVRWMALESLETLTFSSKTDVWSFGVILWELFTRGGHPYADRRDHDIKHFLLRGHRLHKPAMCPSEIYTIMVSCWEYEAQDRPSFADLERNLKEAIGRQRAYYTDPSVLQSYANVEQLPPTPPTPEDDPYTYMVPPGGGSVRDSMPAHLAPRPPQNNNIV